MTYEFASCLYPNEHEMLDALVSMWITADGLNSSQEVRIVLAEQDDSELARDCIKDWQLDEVTDWPGDVASQSHMEQQGYTTLDVANAFTRLRKRLQVA